MSVCLFGQFLSTARTFVFFFFDGFCFLRQLNCPDLCLFVCFFFFFFWVLFCGTIITRQVHYALGSH